MACFKLSTDEVICFLYEQKKKKNETYDKEVWTYFSENEQKKKKDATLGFSFETVVQHIDAKIDWDD